MDYIKARSEIDPETGCWVWQLSVGSHGYGNAYFALPGESKKKIRTAHRLSYTLAYGDPVKLQVNHKCGNRRCCNPEHLYAGTQAENIKDAKKHGTFSKPPIKKGEDGTNSKLTEKQVLEIRRRRAEGERGVDLAKEFGVGPDTICAIHKRKNWGWL